MAISVGTIKSLLMISGGAIGGGSGYLINWPTKSINAGKMQVLFKKFDYESIYTPWVNLVGKTTNGSAYNKPDSAFDEEIVELRKKLKGETEDCINSQSSDDDQNSCKGEWSKMREKVQPYAETLRKYCEKKESEELSRHNLRSMKGYMSICYDMSEMWYFT